MNIDKNKHAILLILVAIATLFAMLILKAYDSGSLYAYFSDRPKRHASESIHLTQLWEISGVVLSPISKTHKDNPEIFMFTDDNKLILIRQPILGNNSSLQELSLLTGDTERQEQLSDLSSAVAKNSSHIFVASVSSKAHRSELGTIEIVAYNPGTGQIAWTRSFVGKGFTSVSQMVADKLAISVTGGFGHSADDALLSINASNGDEVSYQPIADNDFINLPSGQVVHYFQLEELSNSVLLIQPALRKIYAYEPSTNSTLWDLEIPNIVSNIAIHNDTVFFLTDDATLWSVNGKTGDALATLTFKSKYSTTSLSNDYPFRHHVTASNDIVVVYLGDSLQLFAFRFLPER